MTEAGLGQCWAVELLELDLLLFGCSLCRSPKEATELIKKSKPPHLTTGGTRSQETLRYGTS